MLSESDITVLKELAAEYMEIVRSGKCASSDTFDDLEHYMFEVVMEAFYGKNIWAEINTALRDL